MSEWLSKELKIEVKKVFEPRYQRVLLETEVVEIANNLVRFVEHLTNSKTRRTNGKS